MKRIEILLLSLMIVIQISIPVWADVAMDENEVSQDTQTEESIVVQENEETVTENETVNDFTDEAYDENSENPIEYEENIVETENPTIQEESVSEEITEIDNADSLYGIPTGNWGYANPSLNVRWDEYEDGSEKILVFSVIDTSQDDESCSILGIFDETGTTSVKGNYSKTTTKIVLENGVTGIGWKYLYTTSGYTPLYTSDYTVDQSKCDILSGFTKLTTVEPCSTLKRIGWSAFNGDKALTSFDFTKCPYLEEIMNQAFYNCNGLSTVDLSNCNNLQVLRWSSLNGTGKGTNAYLALPTNGVLSIIGGHAFNGFGNGTSGIVVDTSGIKDSVTRICQNAFENTRIFADFSGFTELTEIGSAAFKNSYITGYRVAENITTIPNNTVSSASQIEKFIWASANYSGALNGSELASSSNYEVLITSNVNKLPKNFFKTILKAGDVYFEGENVITFVSGTATGGVLPFSNITHNCYVDSHGVVYELMGTTARVVYCPPGITNYTIPSTITVQGTEYPVNEVAPSAFIKARDLKTIVFEDSSAIETMGASAFENVQTLSRVTDLKTGKSETTVSGAIDLFNCDVAANVFRNTGLLNDIGLQVQYIVQEASKKYGNKLLGELPSVIGDSIEYPVDTWAENYTIKDIDGYYYTRSLNNELAHFPYFVYMFKGWKLEDGSIVQPNEVIDLAQSSNIYDANNDGVVTLVSEWVCSWNSPSTGTPSANITVMCSVSGADSDIDKNIQASELSTDYTPSIGSAIIYSLDNEGNIILPDSMLSPSMGAAGGQNVGDYYTRHPQAPEGKYMMITYVDSTILEADTNIRQLANEGYVTSDSRNGETRWKLSYLPSDEEVIEVLKGMIDRGETVLRDENREIISSSDLSTDKYTVRWAQVKYQSGANDGWNINAKLTKKKSYATITKTFEGKDSVVELAKQNYSITLTNTQDSSDVIKLKLIDKTGGSYKEGKISESLYGYTSKTGNTYKWTVICDEPKTFYVTEEGYTVNVNGQEYGVSVQYNQLNTGNPSDEVMREWLDAEVRTTTQVIDDVSTGSFETTNFVNTYIPEDTFIIEKYDNSGVSMEGVKFNVFDDQNNKLRVYGGNGNFNVLFESGTSSDVIVTDETGRINLKLPHGHTYLIKEITPYGYNDEDTSFNVSVSQNGEFSISNAVGNVTSKTTNGFTWGAKIVNTPKTIDIKIKKTWKTEKEESVEVTLYQTIEDNTVEVKTTVLNEGNNWEKTFFEMPQHFGGKEISYSIRETKIGNISQDDAAFQNWKVKYDNPLYTENGNPVNSIDNADTVEFNITNEQVSGRVINLNILKTDTLGTPLEGATFHIYRVKDNQSSGEFTINGEYTESPEILSSNNDGEIKTKLYSASTYYITEEKSPFGYRLPDGFIKIVINARGQVETELQGDMEGIVSFEQNGTNLNATIQNKLLDIIPSGFSQKILPILLIIAFSSSLFALILIYIPDKKK